MKNKFLLTTALTTSLFGSYKRAYSACEFSNGSYICSGTNTTNQIINANDAQVTTAAGFSVTTDNTNNSISITGDGALSFTDNNNSNITNNHAGRSALYITSIDDINGGNNASITVDINSTINSNTTQGNAIGAFNHGTGTTNLTISGNIASSYIGVNVLGYNDISITTGTNSSITSSAEGISVNKAGIGTTTLNLSGDITATNGSAIYLDYSDGSATNITIQNGATISGNKVIELNQEQDISVNLNLNGSSNTVSITGTSGTAIEFDADANNNDSLTTTGSVIIEGDISGGAGSNDVFNLGSNGVGANLTLTGADITGFETIINKEDSTLTVNASEINGTITSDADNSLDLILLTSSSLNGSDGSAATFGGGDDSISVQVQSTITGDIDGGDGNDTLNLGYNGVGAALILENSNVSGFETIISRKDSGLFLENSSIAGTITTDTNQRLIINLDSSSLNGGNSAAFTLSGADDIVTVSGTSAITSSNTNGVNVSGGDGNDIINLGSGSLTITNSNILDFETIVNKENSTLTLNNSSIVGSITSDADNSLAINLSGSILNGGTGSAATFGGVNDSLTITGTSSITGDLDGGAGTDTLNLGSGGSSANLTLNNSDITNFETIINKENSTFSLNNSSITGTITSDANNSLALNLNSSTLDGGAGSSVTFGGVDDSFTISGTSSITGNVNGGAGNDTLNLGSGVGANLTLIDSNINGFETILNKENSTLTLNNSKVTGPITSDVDNSLDITLQTFSELNGGSSAAVTFGGANDSLTIDGGATITGDVSAGDGNDSLIFGPNLTGRTLVLSNSDITGFETISNRGNSILILNSSSINGTINSNADNSIYMTLSNSSLNGGNSSAINFGDINDFLTTSGNSTITGNLDGGDGTDTLNLGFGTETTDISLTLNNSDITNFETIINKTNSNLILNNSSIAGSITSDADNNLALTLNSSSLNGGTGNAVTFGDSDDSLTITGTSAITGDVDGGAGTDSLNINDANLTIATGSDISKNIENINFSGNNIINGVIDLTNANVNFTNSTDFKVNGDLTISNLTIRDQMTLSGNNQLNTNLIVANGGKAAPGNSIGTINVDGTVLFETGSTFDVEINGNLADKIIATGDITIEPNANLRVTPIGNNSGSATILESNGANGIVGSFDAITLNGNGNVTVLYTTNDATLNYTVVNTDSFASQIQSSVDSSILFNDSLTNQLALNAFDNGNNFWAKGIYRKQDIASTSSNSFDYSNNSYGVAFGAEYELTKLRSNVSTYKLGFAISQISDNLTIESAQISQGSRTSQSSFGAIYGNYSRYLKSISTQFFTSLSLGFGYHIGDNERLVTNNNVTSFATSSSSDTDANATLQAGFKVNPSGVVFVMPYVSASYIKTFAGGFEEKDGGNASVTIDDYSFDTVKYRESIRFGTNLPQIFRNLSFSPYVDLGLEQERGVGNRTITGKFNVSGSQFSTDLKNNDRNFILTTVGLKMQLSKNISSFLSYNRSSSGEETRNEAKFSLGVKF